MEREEYAMMTTVHRISKTHWEEQTNQGIQVSQDPEGIPCLENKQKSVSGLLRLKISHLINK